MRKTITRAYNKLIIKPDQIVALANICHAPWKRDLEIASRKWRNEQLPEIEKKINEHNKDVKNKKSTYSFNTYLPISEQDKKAIIDKERTFFIYTSQRVYEFLSKFSVSVDNKTVENTNPNFLENQDLENASAITFSVKSANGNRTIEVDIRQGRYLNNGFRYSIEGDDDRWINKVEEDIENAIRKMQKPHELTPYTNWIALATAVLLSLTLYQILNKYMLFNFVSYLSVPVASFVSAFVFCIFSWIWIARKINPLFPNFAIKENYNPLDSKFAKLAFFIALAILSPLIWELVLLLFK